MPLFVRTFSGLTPAIKQNFDIAIKSLVLTFSWSAFNFDLNGLNNVNVTADMRQKIFMITDFVGASMKDGFLGDYDKWEMEMEMEKMDLMVHKREPVQ